MSPSSTRRSRSRNSSNLSRRSTNAEKTEIKIHVYDLLPPGRLSSLLWTLGGSLLHSGVVINGREYAYGGHNKRGVTGVYWTRPKFEPPGGTFRCEILQGFTLASHSEVAEIVRQVSDEFLGTRYNLLTNNCNHFTSALCARLTGKPSPAWLNRAASVGLALPCMVPKEWVNPPDHDTADGELLDDEAEADDERAGMLDSDRRRKRDEACETRNSAHGESLAGGGVIIDRNGTPPPRLVSLKDTSGRDLPVAERAPLPKRPSVSQ